VNLEDTSENFLFYGCTPQNTVDFLKYRLKSGDIFIDCGANIGLWTLIASDFTKSEGFVYSFEPNPKLFLRLEKNIKFNNLQQKCSIQQTGLSSATYSSFLYLDDNHHQMGSLHHQNSSRKIKVELKTLDSFGLSRIDGMKIDVEGHELDVIKGAIQTLISHKPWLVVELNNLFYNIQYISQWEVCNLLTEIGYSTNFDMGQILNLSFCRDIIFYDATKPIKEQFPPFL
jgi:FkbM family methyltransferase